MDSKVKYLLSLTAIRERAKIVGDAAQAGQLSHFDLHEARMDDVADFVTSVIQVRLQTLLFTRTCITPKDAKLAMSASAILVRTGSIPFLRMVAGSISR